MKSFFEKVYEIVRTIPPGKVATYGQIARLAGKPHAARMVGWAMSSSSPDRPVPWHRVVGIGGRIVISKALPYSQFQRQLLREEGVDFIGDRIDMKRFRWEKGVPQSGRRRKRANKR
jgi:methylated-DNA-protein-cysteine methyltransferase-like protein